MSDKANIESRMRLFNELNKRSESLEKAYGYDRKAFNPKYYLKFKHQLMKRAQDKTLPLDREIAMFMLMTCYDFDSGIISRYSVFEEYLQKFGAYCKK